MPSTIPHPYRILFTTLEPLLATAGALQALFFPSALLSSTVPSVPYAPNLSPLFTQMTGSWLMLAFHDFVTLRSVAADDNNSNNEEEVRVWRHTLAASSISDVFYNASLVQGMGAAVFFNPLRWDPVTAVAVITSVGPFVGKLCFLAGVGLPKTEAARKRGERKAR